MLEAPTSEIIVSSIMIGDSAIEIGYFEKRDQGERVGVMKTIMMERGLFPDIVNELLDNAEDLVDRGLLELRSPEPVLDPRRRIGGRKPQAVDEEPVD